MKLISCVLYMMFLTIPIYGEEKEALIFDRFNRSLFDLPEPEDIPKGTKCGAWAVACPAETSLENDFVKEYSSTKNALFVREIYERDSNALEVKKNVCKTSFKLSMTYHIRSTTFRFGFEIYYKLKDRDYFHEDNIDDYKTIEEAAANMKTLISKTVYVAGEMKRIAQNAVGVNIKELWFNKNRKMGFMWIDLVKFEFDTFKSILRKMTYDISTNSRWPYEKEQCEDYSLGHEFYRGYNVDKLYSKVTSNTFTGFKLPRTPACQSNAQCFVKALIIPLDQFRFGSSTSPVCSNLATIPVWKIIPVEYLLERLDQYLYALYRVIQDEPLHIVTGIRGEHEYPKNKGWGKLTLYLDSEKKKIPIPKIIYKMIEYRVKDCKLEEKNCWYSCIIVIHNDPFFKSSDKICPSDVTKDWGWQGIKSDIVKETDRDIIYVCQRDKNVMRKLFGSGAYNESQGLKLTKFPFSNDGEKIEEKNISNDVSLKFGKFTKQGDDLRLKGKKIVELAHTDVVDPADKDLPSGEGEEIGAKPESGKEGTMSK